MAESTIQRAKRRYRRALKGWKLAKRKHPKAKRTLLWRRKAQRYLKAYRAAQRSYNPTKVSAHGAAFIADFEGGQSRDGLFRPYRDAVGVWTVGFGHTEGVGPNTKPLTKKGALSLLRADLDHKYAPPVATAFERAYTGWSQAQFDATVSFVYNLGPGVLGTGYTFGRNLRAGRVKATADSLLMYDKAGGRTLAGLSRRRRAERKLFLSK